MVKPNSEKEIFEWQENIDPQQWDRILASMHGHPLQSANWGAARNLSDGIKDTRWVAYKNGQPVFLVRFEDRRFLKCIKVAWSPKGPTVLDHQYDSFLEKEFLQRLKQRNFFLCVTNPWKKITTEEMKNTNHHTIWIDLSVGKDKLWNNLSRQFRYNVRRAKKLGVVIEKSRDIKDVQAFYALCKSLSIKKGFYLSSSSPLMSNLLLDNENSAVESYLFTARMDGKFAGGAYIIRCGESIHYMWGALDREYSSLKIGEAIQWEVMEWSLENNCKLYDLEGIDPVINPGTYLFKKNLGGEITVLSGERIYFLYKFAKIAANFFNPYKMLKFFSAQIKYKNG